ncbi:MAG: hypothetical protein PHY05_03235 [Methanothrix sp.]|nr:hypothetical protein [Methanothrix sp.]
MPPKSSALRSPILSLAPAPCRNRLIVDAEHPVGQLGLLLQVGGPEQSSSDRDESTQT